MFLPFSVDFSGLSNRVSSTREVRLDECRWPIDDAGQEDFHLCRAPTVKGAYCACHAEKAYRKNERVLATTIAVVGKRNGRAA